MRGRGSRGTGERSAEEVAAESERVEKDPFDEIDFGSYFQDYLDPGFRTASNFEEYDKPSFENFLSQQPSTLSDHLAWQLGSLNLTPEVRAAAELVVGNLNENGYLIASDEELVEALMSFKEPERSEPIPFERGTKSRLAHLWDGSESSENGQGGAQSEALDLAAAEDETVAALLAAVREARTVVNYLDPVGVEVA